MSALRTTPQDAALRLVPLTPSGALGERLTVAEREQREALAARPLGSILEPSLSREEVLERIDPEALMTAPLNLLVATAIALAPPDAAAATEDHVLRYTAALTDDGLTAAQSYVRLTASTLVLTDVEYQQAITAQAAAETSGPDATDWKNQQHYIEALKLHERRMDRLLRTRKDAFDRYERAAEVYRAAILTRDGQEVLLSLAQRRASARSNIPTSEGVTVLPAQHEHNGGADGVRVRIQIG